MGGSVPTIQAPAPMPVADESTLAAAKKKTAANAMIQSGRASTIMSQNQSTSDKLGG